MSTTELRRRARRLQWVTIGWNLVEVFVTVGLGVAAGSLALVAFGLDSLVEVFASLVIVWHLGPTLEGTEAARDRRALRLVAVAFTILAVYLVVSASRSLWLGHEPDESPWGIAYLATAAVVMFALAGLKRRVGAAMQSGPFLAEASMTFLDGMLATGILVALVLNAALGWWWADPAAALLVAAVALREAWEGWTETASSGATSSATSAGSTTSRPGP